MRQRMYCDRLADALRREDRTPAWLARRVGVSRQAAYRWVDGTAVPTVERVGAIAEALREPELATREMRDAGQ